MSKIKEWIETHRRLWGFIGVVGALWVVIFLYGMYTHEGVYCGGLTGIIIGIFTTWLGACWYYFEEHKLLKGMGLLFIGLGMAELLILGMAGLLICVLDLINII